MCRLGFSVAVGCDSPRAAEITGGFFEKLSEVVSTEEPFRSNPWMKRLR